MNERPLNYKNVRYGMLVEVLEDHGYHAGCKVHFYNKKGVLVGNYYEFMPYERLRLRDKPSRYYPNFYISGAGWKIKNAMIVLTFRAVDFGLRFTQIFFHMPINGKQ